MEPSPDTPATPPATIDFQRAFATPIKELRESERLLYLAHLVELGSEDRYLRFGSPLSDFAIGEYVAAIDFSTNAVFGVFGDDLKLVAAGHFAPIPGAVEADAPDHPAAEFGLSVSVPARGKGMGTALFLRAAAHARNLDIETLFMHCLTENKAMMSIARKAGMDIRHSYGEADAYLALLPGDAASAFDEALQRQVAIFDFAVKRQVLAARNVFRKLAPAAA